MGIMVGHGEELSATEEEVVLKTLIHYDERDHEWSDRVSSRIKLVNIAFLSVLPLSLIFNSVLFALWKQTPINFPVSLLIYALSYCVVLVYAYWQQKRLIAKWKAEVDAEVKSLQALQLAIAAESNRYTSYHQHEA